MITQSNYVSYVATRFFQSGSSAYRFPVEKTCKRSLSPKMRTIMQCFTYGDQSPLVPLVAASLAAQLLSSATSVNTFHMTSPRGRNRSPHLRNNEPTRSRQGSKQQQQQVQVQVLLRPTGELFCLTQFQNQFQNQNQNQFPELDPGLPPEPSSLPGARGGRRRRRRRGGREAAWLGCMHAGGAGCASVDREGTSGIPVLLCCLRSARGGLPSCPAAAFGVHYPHEPAAGLVRILLDPVMQCHIDQPCGGFGTRVF